MKSIAATILAIAAASAAFCDSLDNIGNVRLKGPLGEKLDRMIARHVAGTDPDYITAPFMEKTETKGWWQTEFWGKWMHSAVPYAVYLGNGERGRGNGERGAGLERSIDRGIERMLASQEENGYIGNYPDALRCGEGWDVWGMKYTMMGLLHYYDLAGGPHTSSDRLRGSLCSGDTSSAAEDAQERVPPKAGIALDACRRLCDYVIAEIGPNGRRGRELWQTGNWSGYASSSILEPVVWLYNRTKEKKYLDFATYIVKGMVEPEKGPRLLDMALKGVSVADRNEPGYNADSGWAYVCKYGRSKAYEMMSCYQGLLDYVEVVNGGVVSGGVEGGPQSSAAEDAQERVPPEDILRAAVMTAEDIVKEEINLAGGCACSEAWFHGAKKQHLPYTHLQETCVTTTWMRFCEKLLEVTGDPKWADEIEKTFYNAYLGAMKKDGSEFAGYTPLSGNRWHGQHHCYMHTDCCTANGPRGFLCFLRELCRNDGKTATFNFYASALVKGFDMYSLYPRTSSARIVSHTEGPLVVRLRIPAWSEKTVVKVNGKEQEGVKAGSYFSVSREWKLGDIVEIAFDMPVVAHKLDHAVAFTRGPVLLARDSRFADGDMTEPFRRGSIRDGQRMEGFSAVRAPSDDIWMTFTAALPIGSHHENPEAANWTTVTFCDYASAGNLWRADNYYRAWFPEEYNQFE